MSLDSAIRYQWDTLTGNLELVEQIDGHSHIVYGSFDPKYFKRYIFGISGEENLDLLDSLRNSPIKLVVTRHEQATVGRLTGKAGCCLSTLGPGATNFTTAAAYAQLAGFLMMMITGQKPIWKSKQGSFQVVDIVEIKLLLLENKFHVKRDFLFSRYWRRDQDGSYYEHLL